MQRNVTIGTTDLSTGATARHDEDELRVATNTLMRASSAIPLIFPPVEVAGTRHVDGGNSANVLTVHGIDRCDAAYKKEVLQQQRGGGEKSGMKKNLTLPNVHIDVILAASTISQVSPEEVNQMSLLQLAAREFTIAKDQLFDHQLRFRCAPGVTSRISMTIYSPIGTIEKGTLAILDFDKGQEVWDVGYNVSRVNVTDLFFCL